MTTAITTDARWWFEGLAIIKARSKDTNGELSIVEMTEPPNTEAPLHVHHREDETFYVLEGSVTLVVGDQTIEAKAGDCAFGPRGVPHRYTVGPDGCRMLFICTPGGFDETVMAMSRPAEALTLPPEPDEEPDWEEVARIARENHCELLG